MPLATLLPAMIYAGTAGWNIPRAHKERFPADGPGLSRYAAVLNAAEINTSFYRPHAVKTYERWAAAVPGSFRFSVKMPKVISHERALTRSREPLERFLEEIGGLGPQLGALLLQLPPKHAFDARRVGRFFELLRARHDGPVVCEPRHGTWTTDAASKLLVKFRVARVAADPPRASGLESPGGWSGLLYYRWHGSPRPYFSSYSADQLEGLATTLNASGGDAWCIFDNTGSGSAAANAADLRSLLGLDETTRTGC
jgi:uncharacterized protein YecE (DUF72 family)